MTAFRPEIGVIGGGMIVHDQILPSLYQLQRIERVGGVRICARHEKTLDDLAAAPAIRKAFPDRSFTPMAGEYRNLLSALPPRSVVIIALPDQLHFETTIASLEAGHHVVCVKPLVLKAAESVVIERESRKRGLMVAVEYHKRLDDRSLMARQRFREGQFGEFRLGNAWLHEKWNYRNSNFQNWFSRDNSDAFTYIGCHYVDLVHFITGLKPVGVSVYGIPDAFPNGTIGYLWSDARVIWDNGACLNVQNALGYPEKGPGSNAQGLVMYFYGRGEGAMLRHSDQYRGLEHCYVDGYSEPSPDYFQYVDLGGPGLTPVGYGYRSIDHLIAAAGRVEQSADRKAALAELDESSVIATPANSRYNELVVEAGRLSIQSEGRLAEIDHASNSVRLKH